MKFKALLFIMMFFVSCKEKQERITFLTAGFQVDYYPKDKSKTGIYSYYTKYGTAINLSNDTSFRYDDTVIIKYEGKEPMKFVRKVAGWDQIK